MGLDKVADPILIIDAIPIPLWSDCAGIISATENNQSAIRIEGNTASPYYLLGSSMNEVQNPINGLVKDPLTQPIVQKNTIGVSFNVQFFIENQGNGVYIAEILMPLLKIARKALDIPCQFIYDGLYMMLGYLQDYSVIVTPDEARSIYTLQFEENIYRLYTEENNAQYISTQSGLPPQGTAPVVGGK